MSDPQTPEEQNSQTNQSSGGSQILDGVKNKVQEKVKKAVGDAAKKGLKYLEKKISEKVGKKAKDQIVKKGAEKIAENAIAGQMLKSIISVGLWLFFIAAYLFLQIAWLIGVMGSTQVQTTEEIQNYVEEQVKVSFYDPEDDIANEEIEITDDTISLPSVTLETVMMDYEGEEFEVGVVDRGKVREVAESLEGKVGYFCGGGHGDDEPDFGINTKWGETGLTDECGDIRPYGLDSSGYVIWVYYQLVGEYFSILGDGKLIFDSTTPVEESDLKIGDLAYRSTTDIDGNTINHLAIYIGEDEQDGETIKLFAHVTASGVEISSNTTEWEDDYGTHNVQKFDKYGRIEDGSFVYKNEDGTIDYGTLFNFY